MAKCIELPHPRSKRKIKAPTAETQECGFYESAFLADRGCFAFMHQRRKPGNARPDQPEWPAREHRVPHPMAERCG
jgi:hypothetical protein